MRKQGLWVFAFLFLTFIGDRIGGYFLQKITEQSQFRYSRLYYSNEDADILFVGNSRGLTFFQPEVENVTGLKTMNLSYNGMPADLAKALVMDYLDKHKAPKTMIVDITLCDRENEVFKNGFNLYTSQSQRLTDLIKNNVSTHRPEPTSLKVDTVDIYAGKKVYYGGLISHLYRYNSEIFQRVLYHKNKTDEDWLLDRVIAETAAQDTANMKSYPVRMFPQMVTHLKEMIDYAKAKGIDVKLVINPYLPAFANSPAIRDSFLTPLKTYVETATGMPVRDFSTALKEREDIGDYQHANKKGSTRYMQILKAEGFFDKNTAPVLGENKALNQAIPLQTTEIKINTPPSVSQDISSVSDDIKSSSVPVAPVQDERFVPANIAPDAQVVTISETHFEISKKKKTVKKGQKQGHWVAVDTLF
jgi:hypothetical protein